MKQLSIFLVVMLLICTSACVTPLPASGPNGRAADNSRNFVLIMHGESCNAENVASNMYCENSHETAIIVVTVDVTWTESGYLQHQNMTVTVPPNSKTLLGCEWRGSCYQRYEIMTASFQ